MANTSNIIIGTFSENQQSAAERLGPRPGRGVRPEAYRRQGWAVRGGFLPSFVLTLLLSLNPALFGSAVGARLKEKVGLALLLPPTHIVRAYRRLALEGAGFIELLPALVSPAVIGVALPSVLRRLLRRAESQV